MGEVINLRQKRKEYERERKERDADANRAKFGQPKSEKELTAAERELADRKLDGSRREDDNDDEPEPA